MYSRYAVYRNVRFKDGAVIETKLVKLVWLTYDEKLAWNSANGNLVPTGRIEFGKQKPA